MAYSRQSLVDEALANLGIVQQSPTVGAGTKTQAELVNRVLFDLGVLSDGREASAGEIASVANVLGPLTANLSANAIVTIADTNAIPNQYFIPFAAIVADSLKDEYGIQQEELQRVVAESISAQRNLKNLTRTFIVDRHLDAILADLAAREIIYLVDTSTIPDEWFMHLSWIVADRCKSKGFDLDPQVIDRVTSEGARALMELRELTRGRPSYNVLRTQFI